MDTFLYREPFRARAIGVDEAERLCDRLAIVDYGKIIAEGTPADLIERQGKEYLQKESEEMVQNNIRLNAIGRVEDLPLDVQTTLQETKKRTERCDGMLLNLASRPGSSEHVSNCGS